VGVRGHHQYKYLVDVVLRAMKKHPDEFIVQYAAGRLLMFSMAAHGMVDGPHAKQYAKYFVDQLNGVELVVGAMTNFSSVVKIQQYASSVLFFIAQWDEFKLAIKKSGGLTALAKALENHGDDEITCKMGRALKKLCQHLTSKC